MTAVLATVCEALGLSCIAVSILGCAVGCSGAFGLLPERWWVRLLLLVPCSAPAGTLLLLVGARLGGCL